MYTTTQTAASKLSINSLTALSPVNTRENTLVSIRTSAMPPVSLSQTTGYFVGRFLPVSPNAENLVVRHLCMRWTIGCLFELLQFLKYFGGSFDIGDTEAAPDFERQFNNNFSHST